MRKRVLAVVGAAAAIMGGSTPARAAESCSNRQTPAEIAARVQSLIARMTVAERIAQLQDQAPAISRLRLPGYNWWNEGLHGLARNGYATVFPQAIGLAATWDPELVHGVGDTVSTEARAKFNGHDRTGMQGSPRYGGLTVWSPNINIFRDPRWGRGQETYGEDPVLTGTLGSAFVRGVQGTDPFYLKADATPKHFVAHSGPEKGRDSFNAVVSAHDLNDTYLRAFHRTVTDGQAAAVMCSYNAINGVPSCARPATLEGTLRQAWGFRGYVVSDCDAVSDIASFHHYAANDPQAAADALKAGTDLNCGNTFASLGKSLSEGLVTEAQINGALTRLMTARLRLGMMDPAGCTPYDKLGPAEIDSAAHRALALRAAEESVVLLKNDGALPLKTGLRVAVVGPDADSLKVLEANYHGTAEHPVTPLEGLMAARPGTVYAPGSLLVEGVPAVVPRTALRVGPEQDATQGLRAEYFTGTAMTGQPAVTAVAPRIDLDLNRAGPDPRIANGPFAARWSGYLRAPAPGIYKLRVNMERCWDCTTHDQFSLYVDGARVLENAGGKNDPVETAVHLDDGKAHAVRLELQHTGADEGIALEWVPPDGALQAEAVKTASQADVVVAFVGLSPDLEGEALPLELPGFDGGDRTSLALPAVQQRLVEALKQTGKPLVVVLDSGSAVTLGHAQELPNALMEAWYPGEAGGTAVARVLTGEVNPAGRLPVTFYRSAEDLPPFGDYSMTQRTYRYFRGPVLYPFGFGLSYTHFAYGPVKTSSARVQAGETLTATVEVRNDGDRAGDEVSEMYVAPPAGLTGAPRLMLAAWQRVRLAPGERRVLHFALRPEDLATTDAAGARAERPGSYGIFLAGSQPAQEATPGAMVEVSGSAPVQ